MVWIVVGAAGAAMVAATAWWHARHGASLRGHRRLCVLSGVLCALALGLLALGAETAGGAGFGLACLAFFCSIALFGPDGSSHEDDEDGGARGDDGPPEPPSPGPVDWAAFAADLERWSAERQSSVP